MIDLKLPEPCKDCLHFEPCTETTDCYADGAVVQRTVTVSCSHEQVCGKRQAEQKGDESNAENLSEC